MPSSPKNVVRRRSSFFSPSPPPPKAGEKEIIAFTTDKRHFSMIRQLHMADVITLMNGWCGFNSVISSVRYEISAHSQPHYIVRAMILCYMGLVFDFLDGRVARWRGKSSLMGQELDSLADLISFGVAPATVGFALGLQTTLDTILLSFFVLCGLTRLARFNVTVANLPKDASGKSMYFEGTPIPTSLVLVSAMLLCHLIGATGEHIPLGVVLDGTLFGFHPISLVFFAHGCAMISKSLKIPKL